MTNTPKRLRTTVLIPAALTGMMLLAACGNEGLDAPVVGGDGNVDGTPARVIAFPDDYGNVATKCDEFGNRVYSSSNGKGASIFVVPADPTCKVKPQ